MPAFNQLLAFAMDGRPKVRKRAAQGLVEVLAGMQSSAALAPASDLVAKGACILLQRPSTSVLAVAWAPLRAHAFSGCIKASLA